MQAIISENPALDTAENRTILRDFQQLAGGGSEIHVDPPPSLSTPAVRIPVIATPQEDGARQVQAHLIINPSDGSIGMQLDVKDGDVVDIMNATIPTKTSMTVPTEPTEPTEPSITVKAPQENEEDATEMQIYKWIDVQKGILGYGTLTPKPQARRALLAYLDANDWLLQPPQDPDASIQGVNLERPAAAGTSEDEGEGPNAKKVRDEFASLKATTEEAEDARLTRTSSLPTLLPDGPGSDYNSSGSGSDDD